MGGREFVSRLMGFQQPPFLKLRNWHVLEKPSNFSISTNAKDEKNKIQERTSNTEAGRLVNSNNPAKAHKEQSPNTKELPIMQLGAKKVDLSRFIKDQSSVYQTIKNRESYLCPLY